MIDAILYISEHSCKSRELPNRVGNWCAAFTKTKRMWKNRSLDRVFEHLRREPILSIYLADVALESPAFNAHPLRGDAIDETGPGPQPCSTCQKTLDIHYGYLTGHNPSATGAT